MTARPLSSRNWFGKASAGVVLGFALALGLSGLIAWAIGVGDTYFSTRGQLTMWAMAPIWCTILSFVFLFRSGVRAWAGLGVATLVVWLLLFATGSLA
ncbi:hypothetical protein LK533_14865 [Sphingomonas sp. PL-96]|uniref:hypothetical protein n=1 Tax=Sphingomonas sp. PL-96 TaxID=2887201 RepID=UPI001E31DA04|nr:hypothetical protein [Sphingomonas sp. PL-96]MCC2977950.1 hypothetical protein [Sphingomonas sp. PL-96]